MSVPFLQFSTHPLKLHPNCYTQKTHFTLKSDSYAYVPILHRFYCHSAGKQYEWHPVVNTGLGTALHTRYLRINAGSWDCNCMVDGLCHGNLQRKHGG